MGRRRVDFSKSSGWYISDGKQYQVPGSVAEESKPQSGSYRNEANPGAQNPLKVSSFHEGTYYSEDYPGICWALTNVCSGQQIILSRNSALSGITVSGKGEMLLKGNKKRTCLKTYGGDIINWGGWKGNR